jgi:hypothetical protein
MLKFGLARARKACEICMRRISESECFYRAHGSSVRYRNIFVSRARREESLGLIRTTSVPWRASVLVDGQKAKAAK